VTPRLGVGDIAARFGSLVPFMEAAAAPLQQFQWQCDYTQL